MGGKKRDTRHCDRTRKRNGLMLTGTEPLVQARTLSTGRMAPQAQVAFMFGKALPYTQTRTQTDSSGFCVGAATRLAEKQRIKVPLWQTDVSRREDVRLLPVWPCS